jgi:hypothetical protein
MRTLSKSAVTMSLILATAGAGVAMADDAAAPAAKPAVPALSDILTAAGLTATGYVDGTYSYTSVKPPGGGSFDTNTFALNQASLSIAYTPASGFGALVNAVAGTEACNGCYAVGYGTTAGTSSFNLLQAYAQYVSGKTTVYAGKFVTLAGAEVAAPNGDTNVTRSLLFFYSEPVTHVGARVAYAATDKVTITLGANNGWNNDGSVTKGGKTAELGLSITPNKMFALAAAGYYGDFDVGGGVYGNRGLVDVVGTWNATSALTVIVNADYDSQDHYAGAGTGTATWYGVAGYLNYAINDAWRVSGRGEYLDDKDSYATAVPTATLGKETTVGEGTVTFGYAPAKNFELRLEGRYDSYKPKGASATDVTQGWVQALFKF